MDMKNIEQKLHSLQGRVGMYYKNMVTGETFSYHADEQYEAASLIKLPVFMHIMKLIDAGEITRETKVLVKEEDKKPSCGALQSLTGDVEVDIQSLYKLMITISDNTASNMLIRVSGIPALMESFHDMGLKKTVIAREFFDSVAAAEGKTNYVCPEEIGMLLESVYRREYISPEISQEIEEVMLVQQIRHKIPGYIGRKKKIANKTGEDGNTTHDGAIVFAKEPFVLVICSNDTNVPETERFIRETALEIAESCGGME